MRAGLTSIQQTLTPEAANILNQSISEARNRNHGQTTPLHVAATLLASPSGYLRQACIRSHPNSSHPLQCRALELCFSVALERLNTAQNLPGSEPPISNALMAALKRAQAHQRRGCPEQQQQPLLAVKVELEQLIISILDDPSVSRVMREASFSSPAVKATIEQSSNNNNGSNNKNNTNSSSSQQLNNHHRHLNFGGIGPRVVANPVQLTSNPVHLTSPSAIPLGNRNLYLNPRLQQQHGAGAGAGPGPGQGSDDVRKVLEIMVRSKKRNPVLVGDSYPDNVVKEILRKIESNDLGMNGILKNIDVLSVEKGIMSDKNQIPAKIKELRGVIEDKISAGKGGVIIDLGDLKWLVEQPTNFGGLQLPQQQQVVSEMGKTAVVEMTNLLSRFRGGGDDGESCKLWLIGTATCETYLRCQVYHSTMENDWDLQAVPIASKSPLPGMFPRMLSNPVDSLNSLKAAPPMLPALTRHVSESLDPGKQQSMFCHQCTENFEKELAKLAAIEKSFSAAAEVDTTRPSIPQWLQSAKTSDQSQGQKPLSEQKTRELQKKWKDTCLHLHPNFHQNTRPTRPGPHALSMPSLFNPNMLSRPVFQSKLQTTKPPGEALQLNVNIGPRLPKTSKPFGEALQLNINPDRSNRSPPGSPVRTDLVLGRKGTDEAIERPTEIQAKDFLGSLSSESQTKLLEKCGNALDADAYKKLLKGLMEKAWWQAEAASAVASAITRCSMGNGKRRGAGPRGDVWLLFVGPDRIGKKKMAAVLADQICGASPVIICLGSRKDDEESDVNFRGKTAIDRIAETVRRNPFSVIMLADIDEADLLVRGSIKRAIDRGRLTDSHGREVGLGNAVFILTGDWSTTNPVKHDQFVDEKKLLEVASGNWQLGLIVREKNAKRRANWLLDGDKSFKARKDMGSSLSLDLNLLASVDNEQYKRDGSLSSSDLTVDDHEEEFGLMNQPNFSITSVPHDLANIVDDSIVFKPVDSAFVRREIKKTISVKFSVSVDENLTIQVEDDVLEKIMGGLWHDRISLEQWIERVLAPSFDLLKPRLASGGDRSNSVVRLVVESDGINRGKNIGTADWLPSSILV